METSEETFAASELRAQVRLRGRRLWLLGGASAALLVAALAAVFFGDARPPDVSDLAFVPVQVADEENLYLALAKLGAELKAKPVIAENEPDDPGPPLYDMDMSVGLPDDMAYLLGPAEMLRERLLRGQGWTPERIGKWRPGFDVVVTEAEKLSGLTRAQGPSSDSADRWHAMEVIQHLKLAARASQAEGRLDEAIRVAGLGWRFARAIRDSRGRLDDYAVGLAAMASFEQLFCELATSSEADAEMLRKALSILREETLGRDGFVDSIKNDFRLKREILARHTAADAAMPHFQKGRPGLLARSRMFFPLMYKRNYSIALYADRIRSEIEAAGLTTDRYRRVVPDWRCAVCQTSALHASFHLWNKEGRSFLSALAPSVQWYIAPSLEWLHVARAMNFSRHSVAGAVAALRLYHLEHGGLPERLEELVPVYLPAVPLDYMDRQPLRYSREFRVVWSVGDKNLTITAADQVVDKREVFYRLDFAVPPETKTSPPTSGAAGENVKPAEQAAVPGS